MKQGLESPTSKTGGFTPQNNLEAPSWPSCEEAKFKPSQTQLNNSNQKQERRGVLRSCFLHLLLAFQA